MKRYFISLLLGGVALQGALGQTVEFDSLYRPRIYPTQVAQFKSYPDSPRDIIFLGNSITARTDWNELLGIPEAKNRGISGDTSFGVLERLEEVIEGEPAKVFLLIGINDISRDVPDTLILSNIKKIVTRIRTGSPDTSLYIHTILPVNNQFTAYPRHYNRDEHILTVNKGLHAMSEDGDFTLIDLHPNFKDTSGRLNAEFSDDGLHLNAKGYAVWAEILRPYLH